ncbi:MAG: glycosyltransferase family 87 protein [Acetobacteraceae bacterium]
MPVLAAIRRADWLTRDRVMAWAAILLALEAILILFIAAWQNGAFFTVTNPISSDFVSFYAAGKLALAGTPDLAYDQAAHYVAQQQARIPGAPYQYFFYPPVFLLLCAGLAALPYFVAYYLFQGVTLALFLVAIHRILAIEGRGWLLPVLAFPALFWNLGVGQNAFLTAALFAGFTLLLDRKPIGAGAMLGLMCYKPHFGILAPFSLLAGGHWRAVFAAGVMVTALVGLSVALFGIDTWTAYLAAASGSHQVYESGRIDLAGMITVFGALRLLGVSPALAWTAQGVVAIAMIVLTAVVWRRCADPALRSAQLLTATLLAVPLALVYDQILLLVAIAWLVRAAQRTGFLSWEKPALLTVYALSVAIWPIGTTWHVPVAPILHLLVLALTLRRVVCAARPEVRGRARMAPFQLAAGATP